MHGGLFSTDDVTLDDLRKIDRNRQPPEEGKWPCESINLIGQFWHYTIIMYLYVGLMCELLWSDPQILVSNEYN